MKKKVALLVAAAMLSTTVLAGCGGGSKGTDESKGSEQGTTTAAGETAGGLDLAVQIGPDPETLEDVYKRQPYYYGDNKKPCITGGLQEPDRDIQALHTELL